MSFDIEFQSEEELKKPIEGKAVVKLRPQYDRESGGTLPLGELKTGKTRKGDPYIIVPVEVVGGEHNGEWAGTTLFVRQDDRRFRKAFEVITGIDISAGGKVNFSEFTEKLKTGLFEVELGPEKPRNEGDAPKYTEIKKWFERVGERDDDVEPDAPMSIEEEFSGSGVEDDIPF